MELLIQLLKIKGVAGDESKISHFLLNYILQRRSSWKVAPEIFYGDDYQDNIILKFGNPRTMVFAHMDTIGFTARYENQLIPVGGPEIKDGYRLEGEDELGFISCKAFLKNGNVFHDFPRAIIPGTNLSYEQNFTFDEKFIQAAFLDNRLGVYNALKLCENLEDGVIVFSTYEEHGGGSVPFLIKFIYDKWGVKQALVSDITWVSEGINHHQGVVISLRDQYIPRKTYINKIVDIARGSNIPFQLEVEASGGSDGREIQMSPYPVDWCFIGAAEDNVHTPHEKVSLFDLDCMVNMYQFLMAKL